ncbi:alpha/beta hydrolase [Rhodococcus sp. WS4]|nr:alpha/beta hydrolase [Rhodococcus sp. WS4]
MMVSTFTTTCGIPPLPDKLVVLVHGGGAHAHWWDHIAPRLKDYATVVAVDLSGHGTSGRRTRYSVQDWAQEVLSVATSMNSSARPVIIGASLGGMVAAGTALASHLAGLVTIDSPIRPPHAPPPTAPVRRAAHYPDLATAIRRFRTVPDDTAMPAELRRHIARHSVRRDAEGWTWKFDPAVFDCKRISHADLRRLDHPSVLLRADHGMADPDETSEAARLLGPLAQVSVIQSAAHHATLEQPVAVTTVLGLLITAWTSQRPCGLPREMAGVNPSRRC